MSHTNAGIYVASRARHGGRWQGVRLGGVKIISTWINEWEAGATEDYRDLWVRNVEEARSASALVAYREDGEPLKGALVEIGAALGNGVPVFFVGSVDGYSFEAHPLFRRCATADEAFAAAMATLSLPSEQPVRQTDTERLTTAATRVLALCGCDGEVETVWQRAVVELREAVNAARNAAD